MTAAKRQTPTLLFLLLAAAVLFAAAFASAPWFAFRALRASAEAGDAQGLAELVDYGAVRASLRPQLRPEPPPAPPDFWSDPLGAMRQAIEPLQPSPPAVDRYLAPQGLAALTRGRAPDQAAADAPARVAVRYWGFRRARIAVRPPEAPPQAAAVFTFQRRGLFTWKLTHLRLPPDAR